MVDKVQKLNSAECSVTHTNWWGICW